MMEINPTAFQTRDVIDAQVYTERERQDKKWGQQNWPDGTGGKARRDNSDASKLICDSNFAHGTGTWALILEEEFDEAMAESDETKLKTELIQIMAVCKAWIECIERRHTRATAPADCRLCNNTGYLGAGFCSCFRGKKV